MIAADDRQLNTAEPEGEPDYKALYLQTLQEKDEQARIISDMQEESNLKDNVIYDLKGIIDDKDDELAVKEKLLTEKNEIIAKHDAATTREPNRDAVRLRRENLQMQDELKQLRLNAKSRQKRSGSRHSYTELARENSALRAKTAGFDDLVKENVRLKSSGNYYKHAYESLQSKYNKLKEDRTPAEEYKSQLAAAQNQMVYMKSRYLFAESKNEKLEKLIEETRKALEEERRAHADDSADKNAQIKALKATVAVQAKEMAEKDDRLHNYESLMNTSSLNSGIPSSMDSISHKAQRAAKKEAEKKAAQEAGDETGAGKRANDYHGTKERPSGGRIGGVDDHVKAMLQEKSDEVFDEIVSFDHTPTSDTTCPSCGSSSWTETGKTYKQVSYEINVKLVKKEETYYELKCSDCGKTFFDKMPPNARSAPYVYGSRVQGIILALLNNCYTPINKIAEFIAGLTNGVYTPCNGYICKVQKRTADSLDDFMKEVHCNLRNSNQLQWDDTVIKIGTKYSCLRFYGNGQVSYYAAHHAKSLKTLIEDDILNNLGPQVVVVHDHNHLNYADVFIFMHAECVCHFSRRLQKTADDTNHPIYIEIKELIDKAIHDRKIKMESGEAGFDREYTDTFNAQMDELLKEAEKLNEEDLEKKPDDRFFKSEKLFLKDIRENYEHYFLWMTDFTIPPDNNMSERALRPVKSMMKISEMFKNLDRAEDYAKIKTYIETCRLHGINVVDACIRLAEGRHYTLSEILAHDSADKG